MLAQLNAAFGSLPLEDLTGEMCVCVRLPALWNACPVKCEAYFSGTQPIPLGWLIQ